MLACKTREVGGGGGGGHTEMIKNMNPVQQNLLTSLTQCQRVINIIYVMTLHIVMLLYNETKMSSVVLNTLNIKSRISDIDSREICRALHSLRKLLLSWSYAP